MVTTDKKAIKKTKITAGDNYSKAYKHTVTLEMEDLGQGPYFSITMHTDRQSFNNHWYEDSGGCQHDEVIKYFPEFTKYIKWHLVSEREPMHYLANSLYWAGKEGWTDGKDNSPPNFKHFKSTAIIGALPSDNEMTEIRMLTWDKADLKSWLESRLDALMAAFRADMAELFNT